MICHVIRVFADNLALFAMMPVSNRVDPQMTELGVSGKVITACELNVASRLLAALLVIGFAGGGVIFPIFVGSNFKNIVESTDLGLVVVVISSMMVFLLSLVLWVVLCRFVPRLLRLSDSVRLEEDRLVFRDRGTVHFRDIAAFNTDDMLKVRPKGKGTLLLLSQKPEYRPFCRAFVGQLEQWSVAHPEAKPPVHTYFYGGLLARTIGCAILALIAGVLSMSLILGIGTAAAIAISVIGAPIPLKLALGKRPPGGRVDEKVDIRNFT